MPNFSRNLTLWMVIGAVVLFVALLFQGGNDSGTRDRLTFTDFLEKVNAGQVADVIIKKTPDAPSTTIAGHYIGSGERFVTYAPEYPQLVELLTQKKVKVSAMPESSGVDIFLNYLMGWIPFILFIGIYIFIMRQIQMRDGGRGGAMGFGKSRARLLTEKLEKVTFENVAGIDEAKEELAEIVDFLKDPQKFQKLGGKIPKGCLLIGPPGTGKTLLARAIAGEAGVPFFTISGSDFVEMFVGVGASRVRDMFEQGKKNAPCIIFIDEIDAVGRHRGIGLGGGNDEREQTLNQLLVEMDGFEANEGVIIVAATNRPDVLDPALLRPGRFDRQINVPNPDITGREKILNVHLKKIPLAPDVVARTIARGTPGFSGADLANLVNEAALLAARAGKKVVTMRELEAAKDKVMMGAERKSMVISDAEKKMTAYHEAGHALVSLHSPAADPVHKATIIPRGRALGMVMRLPEADKLSYLRDKMYADLAISMGGRVAEEIIFGHDKVSSGASSDIKYATRLARAMVAEWGMSEKLGPLYYGDDQRGDVYSGSGKTSASSKTEAIIDEEVRAIVEGAHAKAKQILTDNLEQLHAVAKNLLEFETLSGDDLQAIIKGEWNGKNEGDSGPRLSSKTSVPSSRKKPESPAGGDAPVTA